MLPPPAHNNLIDHLCRQSGLDPVSADRLVQEVLAFYDETTAAFIRRRHYELQKAGLANATIYRLIGEELPLRRFSPESLSERQIRRTIYG